MTPGLCLRRRRRPPNSKFNGVQIGVITYSYRSLPGTAEDLLKYILQCGISSVELMGDAAEQFAGAPAGRKGDGKSLLDWRLPRPWIASKPCGRCTTTLASTSISSSSATSAIAGMPDEQIEYYFAGRQGPRCQRHHPRTIRRRRQRLGPIADKHQILIGFHNHTQLTPTTYDGEMLSHGKYLGINFDIGHYVAGTNQSPLPLIEKHRDRILSLHLKDRKRTMVRTCLSARATRPWRKSSST